MESLVAGSEVNSSLFEGIANVGLVFNKNSAIQSTVVGYMDSIYANDLDKRFLVGYVFTLTSHAIS